ncbi:hypothetical protein M433DRAFT_545453 [Acidomyces richmondensis BFW]|nr:hypothetical protein M433DRAFT_545453 [Acidomyces richmondensis BFW]
MDPVSITSAAVVIALIWTLKRLSIGKRPKGYLSGPPALPIIGNIHQMRAKNVHLKFLQRAVEYGEIYSLIVGTKTLIVLSSDGAVKDLLDRGKGIYSDRPEMYIGQELCSDGLRMLMTSYGPRWRMIRDSAEYNRTDSSSSLILKQIRKMVHNLLNHNIANKYVPYQMLENKQMLNDLVETPDDFLKHVLRYSNAITTFMVFGWRASTYDDHKIQQLFDGFSEVSEINQTGIAALVDFFHLLRNLPDSILTTQKKAKKLHANERKLYLSHWLRAKKEITDSSIRRCFCVGMAQAQEKEGFSDAKAAYISVTLLEAWSDTTSKTLYGFIQAMLLYPEVQRWMPTTILGGVPHATTSDDIYKGYLIPKGAGVMNNVWAINMDPTRAPIPRKFDPTRYEKDNLSLYDSTSNPDATKRDHFTFGAGRRICPGIHVAERGLFLGISRIPWAFDINPAENKRGEPIILDQEKLSQGFVCMPEDFPAQIRPRSLKRAELVKSEWETAEQALLDPKSKQWISSPLDA